MRKSLRKTQSGSTLAPNPPAALRLCRQGCNDLFPSAEVCGLKISCDIENEVHSSVVAGPVAYAPWSRLRLVHSFIGLRVIFLSLSGRLSASLINRLNRQPPICPKPGRFLIKVQGKICLNCEVKSITCPDISSLSKSRLSLNNPQPQSAYSSLIFNLHLNSLFQCLSLLMVVEEGVAVVEETAGPPSQLKCRAKSPCKSCDLVELSSRLMSAVPWSI